MYNLLKLNLARNSLRYIIKTYNITEMYIPYYICDAIRQSLLKEKCKPIFYHIDNEFMPIIKFPQNAYILYPDYFGICGKNVDILTDAYPDLIVDNAHSFYSEPKGFACFNSARKFLPVQNGSYLWIRDISICAEKELKPYKIANNDIEKEKNEILFANENIKLLNDETSHKISTFLLTNDRFKKFLQYHEKYEKINKLKINIAEANSPFCYPLLCENADVANEIAEELIKKGLKIYRYWNKIPKEFNEYKFYERLIPIPLS